MKVLGKHEKRWLSKFSMDDSSYRLNFDLGKRNNIHQHS
jgi:hypothetical protein